MWGLVFLALIAGPTLTLAWLARVEFVRGHYVAGVLLTALCLLWLAMLIGAAADESLLLAKVWR